jgi:hypothetical protein
MAGGKRSAKIGAKAKWLENCCQRREIRNLKKGLEEMESDAGDATRQKGRRGLIQELLWRVVVLHGGFSLDRYEMLVELMRILVKLRQENASGFIELNVIDQHSD